MRHCAQVNACVPKARFVDFVYIHPCAILLLKIGNAHYMVKMPVREQHRRWLYAKRVKLFFNKLRVGRVYYYAFTRVLAVYNICIHPDGAGYKRCYFHDVKMSFRCPVILLRGRRL